MVEICLDIRRHRAAMIQIVRVGGMDPEEHAQRRDVGPGGGAHDGGSWEDSDNAHGRLDVHFDPCLSLSPSPPRSVSVCPCICLSVCLSHRHL